MPEIGIYSFPGGCAAPPEGEGRTGVSLKRLQPEGLQFRYFDDWFHPVALGAFFWGWKGIADLYLLFTDLSELGEYFRDPAETFNWDILRVKEKLIEVFL